MRTLAKVGLLGMIATFAGCGMAEDPDDEARRIHGLIQSGGVDVPLCRAIETFLDGQYANVFRLRTSSTFVAASWGGVVLCVDEVPELLRAGVIPVVVEDEPVCYFCDGTPLPAEEVMEMARKYDEMRTDL